jgi:hypothetical protein
LYLTPDNFQVALSDGLKSYLKIKRPSENPKIAIIPAQAGIFSEQQQTTAKTGNRRSRKKIPACAGMTAAGAK